MVSAGDGESAADWKGWQQQSDIQEAAAAAGVQVAAVADMQVPAAGVAGTDSSSRSDLAAVNFPCFLHH